MCPLSPSVSSQCLPAFHAKRIGWAMNWIIYTSTLNWVAKLLLLAAKNDWRWKMEKESTVAGERVDDKVLLSEPSCFAVRYWWWCWWPLKMSTRRCSLQFAVVYPRKRQRKDWANHFVPAHHRHHSLRQYWGCLIDSITQDGWLKGWDSVKLKIDSTSSPT